MKTNKMPAVGASAPKIESSRGKRVLAIVLMAVGIAALMFAAAASVSNKQELVEIVRVNKPLLAGEVIQEDALESYKMLKADYDSLGLVEVDGDKKQIIIPWSQRGDIIGMYANTYIRNGTYLTSKDITSEVTARNPWVQNMSPDDEIFTMSFNAGTINTRLIFPGTRLRVRLICEVPTGMINSLRQEIERSENQNLDIIVHDSTVALKGEDIRNDQSINSFQLAEIVINDITITDMSNSEGESIYDLYCSLLKLPINERIQYLRTELGDNSAANSWASRTTPSTITFILDKKSASRLAEFEVGGGTLKYTILPDNPEDETQANLMSQFVELSNQINTVTSAG